MLETHCEEEGISDGTSTQNQEIYRLAFQQLHPAH